MNWWLRKIRFQKEMWNSNWLIYNLNYTLSILLKTLQDCIFIMKTGNHLEECFITFLFWELLFSFCCVVGDILWVTLLRQLMSIHITVTYQTPIQLLHLAWDRFSISQYYCSHLINWQQISVHHSSTVIIKCNEVFIFSLLTTHRTTVN